MATAEVSEQPEVVERDIDGVPLRDHKKVDLKAILGHAPEVDDSDSDTEPSGPQPQVELLEVPPPDLLLDDEEEEDGESAEGGDPLNSMAQRQRRSSLRAQHHEPPDSPSAERKAVRFADSLGIGLEAIRDLADDDADEPPLIPHSAMTALRLRRTRRHLVDTRLVLVASYPPPSVDDAFLARLDRQRVLLESSFVSSRDLTISGVVRVADNVTEEKTVTVRYTTDAWVNHRDVPANYVPNSTDRFVFIVHLPEGFGDEASSLPDRQGRIEFAAALHAGSETFWDSNDGGNYVIDCVMRSREPSVSGDPKTPDDFEDTTTDGDRQ